jgi:hypothetical protein
MSGLSNGETMSFVMWKRTSLVAAAALFGASFLSGPSQSHDWYPADCCSGFDCYAIDETDVEVTDRGWRIVRTGEVIEYGQVSRPSERESQDGQFHRCSVGGDPDADTLCLFVPRMAS